MSKPRGNQLQIQSATTRQSGIVTLASKDDVNEPSNKVVTTDILGDWKGYQPASTDESGVLRIATQEDVDYGLAADVAVTPVTLAYWADSYGLLVDEKIENRFKAAEVTSPNSNLLLATDFSVNPMQLGRIEDAPKNGLIADRVIHDYNGTLESVSDIVDIAPLTLMGKETNKALKFMFGAMKFVTHWKMKLPIEGVREGKHILSIAIKANADIKIKVTANQFFNIDDNGSPAVLNIGFDNNLEVDKAMRVLTATVDLPSIDNKKLGKGNNLVIELTIPSPQAGLNLTIPYIKFEEGEEATDMVEVDEDKVRLECMRFHQIIHSAIGYYTTSDEVMLSRSLAIPFCGTPVLDGASLESGLDDGIIFKKSVTKIGIPGTMYMMGADDSAISARSELPEK